MLHHMETPPPQNLIHLWMQMTSLWISSALGQLFSFSWASMDLNKDNHKNRGDTSNHCLICLVAVVEGR